MAPHFRPLKLALNQPRLDIPDFSVFLASFAEKFCSVGQFWISPSRYTQCIIVSEDNQAQSRAPVVKITFKGPFGWAG